MMLTPLVLPIPLIMSIPILLILTLAVPLVEFPLLLLPATRRNRAARPCLKLAQLPRPSLVESAAAAVVPSARARTKASAKVAEGVAGASAKVAEGVAGASASAAAALEAGPVPLFLTASINK